MDVHCPEAALHVNSFAQPQRDLARTARWVAQQSGGHLAFAFSPALPCKYSLTLKRSQSRASVCFFFFFFVLCVVYSLVDTGDTIHCLSVDVSVSC